MDDVLAYTEKVEKFLVLAGPYEKRYGLGGLHRSGGHNAGMASLTWDVQNLIGFVTGHSFVRMVNAVEDSTDLYSFDDAYRSLGYWTDDTILRENSDVLDTVAGISGKIFLKEQMEQQAERKRIQEKLAAIAAALSR